MSSTYKKDFPFFKNNKGLTYLDSAATSQKPLSVINAESGFYLNHNSNIKRGSYDLAEKATDMFEISRHMVASFIGAKPSEVVFNSGSTEGLNAVAGILKNLLKPGDEIIVSGMEHHSNLLPWLELARSKNIKIKYVFPDDSDLVFVASDFLNAVTDKTRAIIFAGASNFTGNKINVAEIKKITDFAEQKDIFTVFDASQYVQHEVTDFKKLNVDFLAFSGHKVYAPMGIGVLAIKQEKHSQIAPVKFGGEMVKRVRMKDIIYEDFPYILEGGTPNVAGAVALAAATEYLKANDFKKIIKYESELLEYFLSAVKNIKGISIYGSKDIKNKIPLASLNIPGIHAHDVGYFLNQKNIAVRVGEHCVGLAHEYLCIPSSVRISLSMYNSKEDIDKLIKALGQLMS